VELLRLITFLKQNSEPQAGLCLPREFGEFYQGVEALLEQSLSAFEFWDQLSNVREAYRASVRFTVSRNDQLVRIVDITPLLDKMIAKLEFGLEKAKQLSGGILPTFLYYEATQFEPIMHEGVHKV
ncbi:hypothetical protein ACPV51_23080, partial [Vibrio astriarenae]